MKQRGPQLAGHLTPRERIWTEIRRQGAHGGRFTPMAIEHHARVPTGVLADYLRGLRLAGYLARLNGRGQFAVEYQLVRDTGVEAPRVDRDGRGVALGRGVANMWRAMKALKHFDFRELRACAQAGDVQIAEHTANAYCLCLARAGYLAVIRAAKPGTAAQYRLARDTGPRAPMIRRGKHVFDPNLNEVVWSPKAGA